MPAIYRHTQLTRAVTELAAAWVKSLYGNRRHKFSASQMEIAFIAGYARGMEHATLAMISPLEPANAAE